MWPEVSSSLPRFLQIGLLLSPVTYKCLLKVLGPVREPLTTLDCVILKDKRDIIAQLIVQIVGLSAACSFIIFYFGTVIARGF
jgi:hypothetical protein